MLIIIFPFLLVSDVKATSVISIGDYIDEFPDFDSPPYGMALSEDGEVIYLIGDFTKAGNLVGELGVTLFDRLYMAAIDTDDYTVTDWYPIANYEVTEITVDGEDIYIAGEFTSITDGVTSEVVSVSSFARLKNDGSVDSSCMPFSYFEGYISAIEITDDYIYLGGDFYMEDEFESAASDLARLQKDTCIMDNSWSYYEFHYRDSVEETEVKTIDSYGEDIFIGGRFDYVYDNTHDVINDSLGEFAKISPDGRIDQECIPPIYTYYVPAGGVPSSVYSVNVSENYIYVAGTFDRIGEGVTVNGLVRLDTETCSWDSDWLPYLDDPENILTSFGGYNTRRVKSFLDNVFISGGIEFGSYDTLYLGGFNNLTGAVDWYPEFPEYKPFAADDFLIGSDYIYVLLENWDDGSATVISYPMDYSAPIGSIDINSSALNTESTQVTLSLSATDTSGVSQMIVCNDSSFVGCNWEEYLTSKNWTLNSSLGTQNVYVRFKDTLGKISSTYSDSIILEAPTFLLPTLPLATIRITQIGLVKELPDKNPLSVYFTSQTPVVKGVTQQGSTVYFVYDNNIYTTVADSEGNFTITLNVSKGTNSITYYSKDVSGNQSDSKVLTLIVGQEYFPESLLSKLGLITAPLEEEVEQQPEQESTPDTQQEEETPQQESTIQTLRFVDKEGNPLVNAFVVIGSSEYYTDSKGEIRVVGLEQGKSYKTKIEYNGVKYEVEVLGESGIDDSAKVTVTEEDISNGLDLKNILIYSGIGLVILFLLILLFKRKRDKEEERKF